MTKRKSKAQSSQLNQVLAMLRQMSLQTNAPAASKRKRKRNRARKQGTGTNIQEGQISVSRKELLGTMKLERGKSDASGHWDLVPDSFSYLKGLFKSFDRVKWVAMKFHYKPAVGTTYGGLISLGMDWDYNQTDLSRDKISGFTPNQSFSAWTDTERNPMVLPASKLMSRDWYLPRASEYNDKGPGKLHWAASGDAPTDVKVLGELWVQYTAVLHGTNPG